MYEDQTINQDPSNSPIGDADLLSYLQNQVSQGAAPAPALAPTQPLDPVTALRQKLLTEAGKFPTGTADDIMRQKMGLIDADGKPIQRSKLGNIANRAGGILQILAGRNYSAEAAKDYQEKLQGMRQAESLLKNEDIDAYKTKLNRLKQAEIDRKNVLDTANIALKQRQLDITSKAQDFTNSLKTKQGDLAAAKALVAQVEAGNKEDFGGLSGSVLNSYIIAKKLTDKE